MGVSKWNTRISYKPKDENIIDAINKVHDQGGIVICNHISWSLYDVRYKNHPSREILLEWGVDYLEIVNNDSLPQNVFDIESYDFCLEHKGKIGIITGTDMHKANGLVSGGIHGWTCLNLRENTEKALINELNKKNTHTVYSKTPFLDPETYES